MTLKPHKVQYSSKNGFSIQWQRPDEITINNQDVMMLLILLKGALNQSELDSLFSKPEQDLIQKYCLAIEEKQKALFEKYNQKASRKTILSDFRNTLDWWLFCYEEGLQKVMSQIWGWNVTSKEALPLVDRLLLEALGSDRHQDRARICDLISAYTGDPNMSAPLPDTIAKIEAVFGALDWEKLKREGGKQKA